MQPSLPGHLALKAQAKRLRNSMSESSQNITHGKSLELIAHLHGYRDWNTLYGAIRNKPERLMLNPGDRITGKYLGQHFSAEVLGVFVRSSHGRIRINLKFDKPVDVVRFESFSSLRQRVTATLNMDGRTTEKTSDGEPQMVIDLH